MEQMIVRVESGNWLQQKALDIYLAKGWRVKHTTTISRGYDPSTTCCLGCLFFPLALLGKKKDIVEYVLERPEGTSEEATTTEGAVRMKAKPAAPKTPEQIRSERQLKLFLGLALSFMVFSMLGGSWLIGLICAAVLALYVHWYGLMQAKWSGLSPIKRNLSQAGLVALGIVGGLSLLGTALAINVHNTNKPEAVAQRAEEARVKAEKEAEEQKQAAAQQAEQEAARKKASDDTAKAKQAEKDKVVSEVSPAYCKSHKKTEVSFSKGGEGWPTSTGNGFTAEECKTIISKLYDIDPRREAMDTVAETKIFNGMDGMLLLYSLGLPDDINYYNYGSGSNQQRVYSLGGYNSLYVYTDDSGKVTSSQQF